MGLLAFIPFLESVLNRVVPDPAERAKLQLELAKLADAEAARESAERIAQTEVNKVEAGSSSLFVAGWRPATGWMALSCVAYVIVLAPLFHLGVPSDANMNLVRDIILGMLGLNITARSLEKIKGVAQNTLTGSETAPKGQSTPPKEKKGGILKKVGNAVWPF